MKWYLKRDFQKIIKLKRKTQTMKKSENKPIFVDVKFEESLTYGFCNKSFGKDEPMTS